MASPWDCDNHTFTWSVYGGEPRRVPSTPRSETPAFTSSAGYTEAYALCVHACQPVLSDPQLPANRHDLQIYSNHVGTACESFETTPTGPDRIPAAETWPAAIPDLH
jgi:hypothetical protein